MEEPHHRIDQKRLNKAITKQKQSNNPQKKSKKAKAKINNYLLCYMKINEIKPESAFSEGWILGNNSESEFTRKLSNAAKGTLKSARQLGLNCEIYTSVAFLVHYWIYFESYMQISGEQVNLYPI